MKLTRIFLRWYKSFNVNYVAYDDRRTEAVRRPWNQIGADFLGGAKLDFIEIPVERDVTTVIGANESGKSHLLSAVGKVLTGKDVDGKTPYRKADLCYYASTRDINTTHWPHIGLQFLLETPAEFEALIAGTGRTEYPKRGDSDLTNVTLIIAPQDEVFATCFFGEDETPVELTQKQLVSVRKVLPRVEFIHANLAISSHIPLSDLILSYGEETEVERPIYRHDYAQECANLVSELNLSAGTPLPADGVEKLLGLRKSSDSQSQSDANPGKLEALLFRDILGVNVETLTDLLKLSREDRSYADGIVDEWNRAIEEKLNLSHYWQQDEYFKLTIVLREGIIYFQITDKTGASYTFRDRSSGLKYFLSYYIQAKALEVSARNRNCIILMDEPDSYLSSIGQKNLLEVFESLVSRELSGETCQLIYTTHSPFLINRNFPRRIRLLRKGDAEEGSQHVNYAGLRRYEPVRSALGIDCGQTLFMGSQNLVLEGPTDQYYLAEFIRAFARPENFHEFIDLNTVTLVSGDSVSGISKLLTASQWPDEELLQTTIVVVDADEAGNIERKRLVGELKGAKKLLDKKFVLTISEAVEDPASVVSIEDIVPPEIFIRAVEAYLKIWHPEVDKKTLRKMLENLRDKLENSDVGIVSELKSAFSEDLPQMRLDKMGIAQIIVEDIQTNREFGSEELYFELELRVKRLSEKIRILLNESLLENRRVSFKKAIIRLVHEFLSVRTESASISDLTMFLERMEREGEASFVQVSRFLQIVRECADIASNFRDQDISFVPNKLWGNWQEIFTALKFNPAAPVVTDDQIKKLFQEPISSKKSAAKPQKKSSDET